MNGLPVTIMVTHRFHRLNDQQKAAVGLVLEEARVDSALGKRWTQLVGYERIDQALASAGLPVPVDHSIRVTPINSVEAWDAICQVLDAKRKGRKLAPEDTKAGIAHRHGLELAKVANERQRFKRAIEILLGDIGHEPDRVKVMIEEFRFANFSSIGGPDYTKPVEEQ